MSPVVISDDNNRLPNGVDHSTLLLCRALKLAPSAVLEMAQLANFYKVTPEALARDLERGLSLPRIAECLRLQSNLSGLENSRRSLISHIIDELNFHPEGGDIDVPVDRVLVGDRVYPLEEYEEMVRQQARTAAPGEFGSYTAASLTDRSIDKIFDVLTSVGRFEETVLWIVEEHDWDFLAGYYAILEDEDAIRIHLQARHVAYFRRLRTTRGENIECD
jgi:hypothetical protein